MKKPSLRWLILILCLVSFARGLYRLGDASMWWDESLSYHRATLSLPEILSNELWLPSGHESVRTVDNHPPLYFALLRLVLLAAGRSEFALRFLSLVGGVLLVSLTGRCATRLFDRWAGVGAAALAAFSPLYLWYQQEMRPYTMFALWGLFSFYLLLRMLEAPRPRRVALYVLAAVAMLATHYLGFLLLAAEGVILLLGWAHGRRRLLWALLPLAVGAGAILVWAVQAIPAGGVPGLSFVPLPELAQDVAQHFTLGLYADRFWLLRWVGVGLLALSLALAWRSGARARRSALYAALCLLLPLFLLFAISFVQPAYMNARHLILSSPFYYVLLGAGPALALDMGRRRWVWVLGGVTGAAWAAVVVGMGLSTGLYFGELVDGKADHRGWGRYLSEHVRPGDLVVVNPAPVAWLYTYYADSPADWVALPYLAQPENGSLDMRVVIGPYRRVWLAYSSTPAWADPEVEMRRWLTKYATRFAFASFRSDTTTLQAIGYRLGDPVVDAPPADVRPPALDVGGRLVLLGWEAAAAPVPAGGTLPLSLYWSAPALIERDYRASLALVDSQGLSWAEIDYAPAQDTFPTSEWLAGQTVRDDVDLSLPAGMPPGRYQLTLSVYPADGSGPALAIRAAGGGPLLGLIVPLGEVEIARPERPPADDALPLDERVERRLGPLVLVGYDDHSGAYYPGDVVLVEVYWRAAWDERGVLGPSRPGSDLTVALQLLDTLGAVRAERAISPAASYATDLWTAGEVVLGRHRFRLPADLAPGAYALALEMQPLSRSRIALYDLTVLPADEERTFEVPPMQHTVGANLGDRVALLGYDLEATTVQAGGVVSYTLYWRALDLIPVEYTVYNHLLDAAGQTWGQWDNPPARGSAPTTRWVPGQVIADPYQVPVSPDAPAGPLAVRVGMYDLGMTRLPVLDESGQVLGDGVTLCEVEVRRE